MNAQTGVSAQRPRAEAETDGIAVHTAVANWIPLVRSEYLEIPGLHLTRKQVERLWNLDGVTCDALLRALLDVKFLRRTADGGYVRTDSGAI